MSGMMAANEQLGLEDATVPDKALTPDEIDRNRKLLRHVKPWLKHRDLTQRRLADLLDVSEPTVSKWLNGKQAMTVAQFQAVASLVNATPEEMMLPPDRSPRALRYRDLARIAGRLSDQQLAALTTLAETMSQHG